MNADLPFIDPTAGGDKTKIPPAPRPIDLAGKVVGLLDNTKEQADIILQAIGEALRERHGVARVIVQRKDHYSKPATTALLDAMADEVHVAIAAVGGWGSCTLCSVHDTIEFERRGVPATVIITQAFRNACLFQFRGKGMEGHSYIELPHPISNLKPDEMRALALKYVDAIVGQLTA